MLITALPKTTLNLTSCKLEGHKENHNAGCILIKCDVMISDCTFKEFNAGAIYCIGRPGFPKYHTDEKNRYEETVIHPFTIRDSIISNCHVVGVCLYGEGSRP